LGANKLLLEGDSLVTVMALKNPILTKNRRIDPIIRDTLLTLSHILFWDVAKVYRQANSRAHLVAKWAAN